MIHLRLVIHFLLGSLIQVSAIVTSGDPNDPRWIIEPADAPFFVSLFNRGECAGTIVGKRFVVTAAHCVCNLYDKDESDAPTAILWNDERHQAIRTFFNPDCLFSCEDDGPNRCDVAVLEFNKDLVTDSNGASMVDVYPYPDDNVIGGKITIYGYGLTGDAGSLTSDRKCRNADEDYKFRRAENIVTSIDEVINYRMDNALNGGLDLEGMAQDGDSGGPATMEGDDGSSVYLVGANSGTSESNPCDYESIDQYAKVYGQPHFDFVSKILDPNDLSICPYQTWWAMESIDDDSYIDCSAVGCLRCHFLNFFPFIMFGSVLTCMC